MTVNFNLESDLQKIIDCDALEVYQTSEDTVYIPFMMNDALECYFKFTECKVIGEWDKDFEGSTEISLAKDNSRLALILRQGESNVVTIWHSAVEKHVELYQYHRIAHIWVKGNEKWRRLVYIIGTLHDKLNFMGPEFCLDEEKFLVDLMGFAPFRYWTPIHESLDEYYSNTQAGVAEMYDIAVKLEDKKLLEIVSEYSKDFTRGELSPKKIKKYAKKLIKVESFYQYLNKKIEDCSCRYNVRGYTEEQQKILDGLRKEAAESFEKKGFSGSYPYYKKGKKEITFFEEHPYVMRAFEYENYDFKINPIKEHHEI